MSDQEPLSQEQQANAGFAREFLEEAQSPFREIHPSFHVLCSLFMGTTFSCGMFTRVGKYSCMWARTKVLAPPNAFYSQPVQDVWEHSFAPTALKLLSQMEAAGMVLQEKKFSAALDSLISPLLSSAEILTIHGCCSAALGLCTLPRAAVPLSITSFFALSSVCPLMSVLEVLISLADQIIPDVHSGRLFLTESLSPGSWVRSCSLFPRQ